MRRDWSDAQRKRQGGCRICGHPNVELAHVIARRHDRREGNVVVVDPDSVVPLCKAHHDAYDERRGLDLLPYLTVSEQARAVLDAGGIEAARHRIVGRAA